MSDYKFTQNTATLQKYMDGVGHLLEGEKVDEDGVVDENGRCLSKENYTSAEKTKLGALPTSAQLQAELAGKQDVIEDLTSIRNKANSAYQKPSSGIPKTDLDASVKDSLDKADSSMQKDTSAGENDIAVFNDEGQVVGAFDVNEVVREGRIKQTTGQSTTDLMSQKAVTDALDTKAAKDEDAVEGNLAKFDANGNPVDAGIAAEKVAQKGEIQTYSGNLVDTRSAGTAQEFTYRKSGGDGVNWMRRIKGKSLVWNQLVKNCTTKAEVYGITRTKVNNYTIHYSGTSTQSTEFTGTNTDINVINGHKYYAAANGAPSNTFVRGGTGLSIVQNVQKAVIQATADTLQSSLGVNIPLGISVDNDISFVLIDLTLMFGEGKEPSTVEEFEALYNEPYYPYQPGVIKNNDAVAMESVGFNQWDEEWENGTFNTNTGANINNNQVRCKNLIPVFPNTEYYADTTNISGAQMWAMFYDAGGNIITDVVEGARSRDGNSSNFQNIAFTTPAAAAFMKFYLTAQYGTTYNNDICINLSDASRNGTYEPYWKKSIQLGLNAFRVTDGTNVITVNGLKSAGSVYDEIDPVRKKYIKRIGEVDMGTLTWFKYSDGKFYTQLTDMKVSTINLLCSKYIASALPVGSSVQNGHIACGSGINYIYVGDSAYSDAASFKTAMSGVMLQFELATPVEYDLVDDIPNAIEVDENGTERAIFPEAVDPSAPFAADSNYSVSTANLVRKLNDAS